VKGLQESSDKINGLGLLSSTSSEIMSIDNDNKIIQDFESQLSNYSHLLTMSSASVSTSSSHVLMKLDVYIKYIKWMRDR